MGSFFRKIGYAIVDGFEDAYDYIRDIPWTQPVKPAVGWSIVMGAFAIFAGLMVLVYVL